MTTDGTRMTRIWEKNDFIMTYRVTQIIYNEIKRLENINVDKNNFAEVIMGPIDAVIVQVKENRTTRGNTGTPNIVSVFNRNSSVLSDMGSTNSFHIFQVRERPEDIITRNKNILQAFYIQGNKDKEKEAIEIHKKMWSTFAEQTLNRQKLKAFELNQSTNQQVFLWFEIAFTGVWMERNTTRSFQIELMYEAKRALSHKVKFEISGE